MNRRRPWMILLAALVAVALVTTAIVAWPRPADDDARRSPHPPIARTTAGGIVATGA